MTGVIEPGRRVGVDVGRRLTKFFVARATGQGVEKSDGPTQYVCESEQFLEAPLAAVRNALGQLSDLQFSMAACTDEIGLQIVSAMEGLVSDGRFLFIEESIAATAGALADHADRLSLARQATVCHVDVGAHSVSAQVFHSGQLIDGASLEIGASFMTLSEDGTVMGLSDSGETFLDGVAKKAAIGEKLESEKLELFSMLLGEVVAHFLHDKRPPQLPQRLLSTDKLRQDYAISHYLFAGGVFATQSAAQLSHGDLGPLLQRCILESMSERHLSHSLSGNPLFARASGLLMLS